MKNPIKSKTDFGFWKARIRKIAAATAVIGVTIAFAGGTSLARHHDEGEHGRGHYEHREWHGHDWDDRGPGYAYNGPDYYYAPQPEYYYEPDPYEYYPPEPDYYPPPPDGISRFFGLL